MSGHRGYAGRCLEFLKANGIAVGDSVMVTSDSAYRGIVMPRYEHADDRHIVLKLESGYNVGLETARIGRIEKIRPEPERAEQVPVPEPAEGLPRILLVSTGGTIASKIDYRTGAVTPALSAEELSASVPELAGIANVDTKELLSEYSENIRPEHWVMIADEVARHAESGYAGIMVAHGTDTMQYTSAFLSFALAGFPIPVVMVGSQRSSDRASSDAAPNLIGAARFIAECGARGVYVAMHLDENDDAVACHLGTRVRKNHTSKRGAFQTVGAKPAFVVRRDIQANLDGEFFRAAGFEPRTELEPKVALVKYHPGLDPALLDGLVDAGYRGIIFEGTGLGHIGDTVYDAVRKAAARGVFMGMTSQCIDGRVSMTVYESGRDLLDMGMVPLEDMLPEVALVKAMWAFGNYADSDVKSVMLECVASEVSS